MKISNLLCSTLLIATVLSGAGCAGSKSVEKLPPDIKPPKSNVLPPNISSADCVLTVPRDVKANSGTPCDVDVQLINNGRKDLTLKEWYMLDRNNFSIYYRRVPADRPVAKNTPFKKYTPHIPAKPRPRHAELNLKPGNRAMVTVTLPFTGELAPGEPAVFQAYIATSLVTFKIKSNLFTVYAN